MKIFAPRSSITNARLGVACVAIVLGTVVCERRTNAPVATSVSPTPEATPAHPLYFDASGDAIRLSNHAAQLVPDLARALAGTAIDSAEENAEIEGPHGPTYHVHIATVSAMDVAALESLASRNAEIGGVMFEPTHVSIPFALATPVAPIAAAMLLHCTDGLPADLALVSAKRSLTADGERLVFLTNADDAAAKLLGWASDRGVAIGTTPPIGPRTTASIDWMWTVFDLRPRAVALECIRRRPARER